MTPCLLYGVYNIWFYYNIFSLVICVCGLWNPSSSHKVSLVLVWIGNNSSYSFSFPLHTAYIPYTRSTLYFFSFWFFSPESVETYCPRTKHLCIRHPLSHASFLLPRFFILPHWRYHPLKPSSFLYTSTHYHSTFDPNRNGSACMTSRIPQHVWLKIKNSPFSACLFISHKYSWKSSETSI